MKRRTRFIFYPGALSPLLFLLAASSPIFAEPIAPANEVSIDSGSLRLSLKLHQTKIHGRERLWVAFGLKNIGNSVVVPVDEVFENQWGLIDNARNSRGIFMEIRGADGELVVPYGSPRSRLDEILAQDGEVPNPAEQSREKKMDGDWERVGFTNPPIFFKSRESPHSHTEDRPDLKAYKLFPGDEVRSRPWINDEKYRARRGWFPPRGSAPYMELAAYAYSFPAPGKYRIRAVFIDTGPIKPWSTIFVAGPKGKLPVDPGPFHLETPWVEFSVEP